MTECEPRTFGVGSDRSTNWATTTAQPSFNLALRFSYKLVSETGLYENDFCFDFKVWPISVIATKLDSDFE